MEFNVDIIKRKIEEVDSIIFDLDGTLIDTEKLYLRFWCEASKYYGYELTKEQGLGLRSRERLSGKEYLTYVSGGILDYDLTRNKRIELMNEYLKDHDIEIKEGAVELLTYLKDKNKKLYIVSANTIEKSTNILTKLNLIQFFDGIISAKNSKRGKPFPDPFLDALILIKKKPEEVIVFEDSPNGLLSSSRAGCFTVMVEDLTPYTSDMSYVDGAISSLKSLLQYLSKINPYAKKETF